VVGKKRRGQSVVAAPWGPPDKRPAYIESVSPLGTTWYDRGPAYWLRRMGATLLMLLVLGVQGLLIGGFLAAIYEDSRTGFAVVCGVLVVMSIITGVYGFRRSSPSRAEEEGLARRRGTSVSAADARRAGLWGAGIGTAARAGSVLGSAVLVIGSCLTLGLMIALLIRSFGRELYAERAARAALPAPRQDAHRQDAH